MKDLIRRTRGVDHLNVVSLSQPVKHANQPGLVLDEAVIHVFPKAQVHAAFPIIEVPPS